MIRFATLVLLGVFVSTAVAADEAVRLFNGKDLSGWEGDPKLWSVQDAAITGTTTKDEPLKYNKFLIWKGGTVENFELRLKYRIKGGNSGVQYRSKHLKDAGEFVVGGYQADIDASGGFTGILYEERGRGILAERGQKVILDAAGDRHISSFGEAKKLLEGIDQSQWNDYLIVAKGNHLTHTINGRRMIEIVDHQKERRAKDGILALQIHVGPPMVVQFKDLQLTKLPSGGELTPEQTPIPPDARKVSAVKPAPKKPREGKRDKKNDPLPPGVKLREPPATPAESLKVAKDFKVELLHSVPKDVEGSWVCMCVDPEGRLIVCDQYGGLFRVTPPPLGGPAAETKVEKLAVDIGEAQGLLWAFDSLYVMVNKGQKYESGLYRVRDTNGDGELDDVRHLRRLNGGGEHGPHAILLAPDGKSLVVIHGNQTRLTEIVGSRVPRVWGEDHLLPRMPDGRGFMAGVLGPGGAIYKVDPEGKNWELLSVGYRNQYDAAFNRHGDLFTYDADMEWDFNAPWYRPTRVCLATSGSEFGWRNGAGKWPAYYPDSLPAIVDIGPGSPTGVVFGYGAKFPAKYQDAFFICDWSYGKLYAVHLTPDGSAYQGVAEEFVAGSPLPLTDLVVNHKDGALYFAIGGRRTKSGLYRVTYAGKESTAPSKGDDRGAEQRGTRRKLESFHGRQDPAAVETAWLYLGHPDRYLRFAARVAIEHQDAKSWEDRALTERDPQAALTALLALVRVRASDPFHRPKDAFPPVDLSLKTRFLVALERIAWDGLTDQKRLELLRVYAVAFNRMGAPDELTRARTIKRFDAVYPSKNHLINGDLCQLLVYLQAPTVAAKSMKLLEAAPTQEEQIEYARSLRMLKDGWTPELRKQYFAWFLKAGGFKGGNSFGGFMNNIKRDAVDLLSESEKVELKPILEAAPQTDALIVAKPRPFVKKWALEELNGLVEKGLTKRDFDRGRSMFAAANCFACHRYDNQGGANGPDLTGAAGRFSVRDLLEAIVEPSKVISDQYAAVNIETLDGKVITGRIVNLHGDGMSVNTDMLNPNGLVNVDRRRVESMTTSKISMMPEGLMDTLNQDEVLDLLAYLLARGERAHAMFRK